MTDPLTQQIAEGLHGYSFANDPRDVSEIGCPTCHEIARVMAVDVVVRIRAIAAAAIEDSGPVDYDLADPTPLEILVWSLSPLERAAILGEPEYADVEFTDLWPRNER